MALLLISLVVVVVAAAAALFFSNNSFKVGVMFAFNGGRWTVEGERDN